MLRKYPAMPMLIAVVLGIVIGDTAGIPSWAFLSAALALLLIALALWSRSNSRAAVVSAVVSIAALSGFHYVIRHVERGPHHAATVLNPRTIVRLFGEIADWPDLRNDHTDYVIALDSVDDGRMRRVDGRILLRVTDTTTALERGDRIECYGRVYLTDPRSADHNPTVRRMSLRGICGTVYLPTLLNVRVDRRPQIGLYATVDKIRSWILRVFDETLSPEAAALAGGFVLGETRHISTEMYSLFRDSGTLHVLAVSGSNVALVLLFALLVLRPFGVPQPWRGVILLAVVLLFALLSYSQPSVIRASIMAAFVIGAGMLGREYDLNHIVSLTVLTVLAAAPSQLFDIGFQLSVVTAWGLVLLVKPAAELFKPWHNKYWYRWLLFPVIVSIVAQLCSAPLIGYYFGKVPLVSIPANLVVVPLTSLAVVLLLGVLAGYLLIPFLGIFAGTLVDPVLTLLAELLKWFHGLQWAFLDTGSLTHRPLAEFWIGCYYMIVIAGIFGMIRRPARRWTLGLLIVTVNLFLVSEIVTTRGRKPEIHFNSLPGGIVAVVDQADLKSADLIVGSGRIRIDNLDSRLLQPVLDMHGVKKLRYLFVLSATFDNIDDLFRTAIANQCAAVYVAAGNRASFEDYLTYHPEVVPPPITYFSGHDSGPLSDGYRLSESGIAIQSQKYAYLFLSSSVQVDELPIQAPGIDVTAVIATRWAPATDDWIRLKEQGIARIVCSRIEQRRREEEENSPADDADIVLPDFTIDLYRSGPYSLPL